MLSWPPEEPSIVERQNSTGGQNGEAKFAFAVRQIEAIDRSIKEARNLPLQVAVAEPVVADDAGEGLIGLWHRTRGRVPRGPA